MIKVYDNFLPKEYEDELLSLHTDEKLPWFFIKNTVDYDTKDILNEDIRDNFQLYHTFFLNKPYSQYYENVIKVLDFANIKSKKLIRIKSNLNTNISNYKKSNYQIPHTDSENDDTYSFLYYINDSDGDTVFFKDNIILDKITPKKGTAVLFKSNTLHCASNPIEYDYRIVTNFVFEV